MLVLFSLPACLLLSLAPTAAALDLGCQTIWSGPSDSNDVVECFRGRVSSVDFWFALSPAILLASFAALAIVLYIPFFLIRQCCNGCGSRLMRPGTCCYGGQEWDERQEEAAKTYPYPRVRCYKISLCFVLLGAIAATALIVYGVVALPRHVRSIEQGIRTDVVEFLQGALVRLETLSTGTPTFTFTSLDGAIASARTTTAQAESQIDSVIAIVNRYTVVVQAVLAAVAAAPTLTAILTIVLMCLSIRNVGPALCTCWTFFWTVVFLLIGVVMMLILSATLFACGEYTLAETFRPGLVQWYLIPLCSASNGVEALATSGNQALTNLSQSACNEMLAICSNSSVFNASTPEIAFDCDLTPASVNSRCVGPLSVESIVNASSAKAPGLCTGCTMSTCPTQCVGGGIRNASASIVDGVAYGVRADATLNDLAPQITCDALVLRVLSPLRDCNDIRNDVAVLAVGCAWGGLMLAVLIVVQFKGQKWFLSPAEGAKAFE